MNNIDIALIHKEGKKYFGKKIEVVGWLRTVRDSKNMMFLAVNDGTCLKSIQVVIDKDKCKKEIPSLRVGASVHVTGEVVTALNDENGFEINMTDIEVLGDVTPDYPLQKKYHSLEFLRTIPHLRVRTNTFNAMLRVRSKLSFAIHEFFQKHGFTYINTPIITGSDCEGAGEIFRVTIHDFNSSKASKDEIEYIQKDFFKRKAGLTVSGQLEGEVAAMAMGKIYTFGPTFRAENSNTPRHAAEFWQIEPEVAFAKLPDIIKIAEKMIKYIIKEVLNECSDEINFFENAFEKGLREKLENVINSEFVILDYTKAIEILKKAKEKFDYKVEWGLDLQTEHEKYITEKIYNKPVFIINYPKKIKSFYMKQNDDGKTVAATDLLVPGIGEIIGCSEREENYEKLRNAIIERGMNEDDYTGYLDLRKYGTVPHSGFGLGLERIMMYLTGITNIRDVQLYPRTPGDLSC